MKEIVLEMYRKFSKEKDKEIREIQWYQERQTKNIVNPQRRTCHIARFGRRREIVQDS